MGDSDGVVGGRVFVFYTVACASSLLCHAVSWAHQEWSQNKPWAPLWINKQIHFKHQSLSYFLWCGKVVPGRAQRATQSRNEIWTFAYKLALQPIKLPPPPTSSACLKWSSFVTFPGIYSILIVIFPKLNYFWIEHSCIVILCWSIKRFVVVY